MNPLMMAMMQAAGPGAQPPQDAMPATIGSGPAAPMPLPSMAGMQPMQNPGAPPIVPQPQPFFQPGTQQFDLAAAIAENQQRQQQDEARMEMLKAAAKPQPREPAQESRNF